MRRVLIVVTLLGAATARVSAQRVASSVDVSGTSVWYADTIRASGGSLAPAVRVDWTHATVSAAAELSGMSGNMSTQALVAPSIFTPSYGPFFGELAGSLGGSTHQDGTRTGQILAIARGYFIDAGRGGWLGGGAGRTWDGVTWRGVRQAELGGWMEHRSTSALATITPVVVADTIRYVDLQAAVRHPSSSLEVGLVAGVRGGASGPAIGGSSRAWGSVTLLKWVAPRLAIVGAAGSYPVDLTQGFPGGRFVSLAMRIASPEARRVEQTLNDPPASSAPLTFETRSLGANRRMFRIAARGARMVEINGDFTAWTPLALVRGADGVWTTTRTIGPGTYQMNVRIDGGAWIVPPGLLMSRDEFGNASGILVIE